MIDERKESAAPVAVNSRNGDSWQHGAAFYRAWASVGFSHQIRDDRLYSVRAFGRDLIAYRGLDGRAGVFDAFCPHFGANIGKGGQVRKGCVECPFHGWTFDGAGDCQSIPGQERIPSAAHLTELRSIERNGHVYVWFSPDDVEPTYEPVEEPADRWRKPGAQRAWTINTRSNEIVENAFDGPHFEKIHKIGQPTSTNLRYTDNGVGVHVDQVFHTRVFGRTADSHLDMTLHDPFNIISILRRQGNNDLLTRSSLMPIDQDSLVFRFEISAQASSNLISRLVMPQVMTMVSRFQIRQDKSIWENKQTVDRPVATSLDSDLLKARRWLREFQTSTGGPAPRDRVPNLFA